MRSATHFSETTHGSAHFDATEPSGPNNTNIGGELLVPVTQVVTVASRGGFLWAPQHEQPTQQSAASSHPPELALAPSQAGFGSQLCWIKLANGYRLSYATGAVVQSGELEAPLLAPEPAAATLEGYSAAGGSATPWEASPPLLLAAPGDSGAASRAGDWYAPHEDWAQRYGPRFRHAFLRRVYLLLTASLAAATAAAAAAHASASFRAALLSRPWALPLSLVLSLGTLLLLALSEALRRDRPRNALLFVAFAAGQALLAAVLTAATHSPAIPIGLSTATACCLCLTLLSTQHHITFTARSAAATAAVPLLLALVLLAVASPLAVGWLSTAAAAWSAAAAAIGALFAAYTVYDILAVMYGNHAYVVQPCEHVFAALSLYLDLVNVPLFRMHVMQLGLARMRGPQQQEGVGVLEGRRQGPWGLGRLRGYSASASAWGWSQGRALADSISRVRGHGVGWGWRPGEGRG